MNYGTIAVFRTYHTERGRDVSSRVDADITAALVVASEWIDATFRSSFGGLKIDGRNQVREWPRTGALDVDGNSISHLVVPVEIENATYQMALTQLEKPGALSVDYTPSQYKRASVDGAVSVEYAMFNSSNEVQTKFRTVEQILSGILTGQNSQSIYSTQSYRA